MLFGQKTHPLNFAYGTGLTVDGDSVQITGNAFQAEIRCDEITDACARLRFINSTAADQHHYSDAIIEPYRQGQAVQPQWAGAATFITRSSRIQIQPAQVTIHMASGALLETVADGFGFTGEKFILNFKGEAASGFYGFGERTKDLNKRGHSLDFWNVDVVATFPHSYDRDDYDPAYVAIPLAIIKTGSLYTGIYFDNPGRAVMDVGQTRPEQWWYQSMAGNTAVYFINGPTLREVVRQFTLLTGRAPVPPLWSLGYHQSRWGYASAAEFRALQECFQATDVPVSAFWYDIDYMDGYRLFTWNTAQFPDPTGLNNELKRAGIRTVTIIDPGVKREPAYAVYESGRGLFCRTLNGRDYVGKVWPGDVVFPDFTLESTRRWWAEQLARFVADSAIDGVWLDMNDPATGYSDPDDMRFAHGTVPHERYHNQYAHCMAKASWQAFEQLDPQGRPFLLTRSGWTGTQRYSAIWTGDNVSNWRHLRMSIAATLNLGLSGVAFNGPDIGGFMGDTTPELLIRWYQAGFLFPFFRNHSAKNSKPQEPWQFGPQYLAAIRETIKTRYRLLPYLYTCFFNHYLSGDPVLRPLLYHYNDAVFDNLDDEFLVGDSILVAPVLVSAEEGRNVIREGRKQSLRHVTLPPGWWFDLNQGAWIEGGKTLSYAAALDEVPWFVRDGAILPYYQGPLNNSLIRLDELELHLFTKTRPARLSYFSDDQATRRYQDGHYNTAQISAAIDGHTVRVDITETGAYPTGTVRFSPVLYGCQGDWQAVITHNGVVEQRALRPAVRSWVCQRLSVLAC